MHRSVGSIGGASYGGSGADKRHSQRCTAATPGAAATAAATPAAAHSLSKLRRRSKTFCIVTALTAVTLTTLVWSTFAIDAIHGHPHSLSAQQTGGEGGLPLTPTLQPHGRASSPYNVSGGYWRLESDSHSFPKPGLMAKLRYRGASTSSSSSSSSAKSSGNNKTRSCLDLAKAHIEPFNPGFYGPRNAPPLPLPGDTPRIAWRWSGRISRQLFDAVPFLLRERSGCHHCTFVLRYKILDGRLYVDKTRR